MSRLDSDRRSPEPYKGSYRRDVGCEEAPAYRGGRQAGGGVGVTYRRDVGCEEAPAYRGGHQAGGGVGVTVTAIVGTVLGCALILGCEDSWSPPAVSRKAARLLHLPR